MRPYIKPLTGFAALAVFALGFGPVADSQVSNCPPAGCTLAGSQQVYIQSGIQSFVKSYRAVQAGIVPVSGQQDLLQIKGSESKTIRITRIAITGENSSAASVRGLQVARRSTADSTGGGTATAILPLDTNNSTATAVVTTWTAAQTLGTAVGEIAGCRLLLAAAGAVPGLCDFRFGANNDQTLVLRGASDYANVVLLPSAGGVVGPATTDFYDVEVTFTEEP